MALFGRNFGIRKHVLQYDDVMNKQREIIYAERRRVLEGENLQEQIEGMIHSLIEETVISFSQEEVFDGERFVEYMYNLFMPRGSIEVSDIENLKQEIEISLVGKYTELHDAYLSVVEALKHAGYKYNKKIKINWIDSESLEKEKNLNNIFKKDL